MHENEWNDGSWANGETSHTDLIPTQGVHLISNQCSSVFEVRSWKLWFSILFVGPRVVCCGCVLRSCVVVVSLWSGVWGWRLRTTRRTRRRTPADIQSNNPHLTGGEQNTNSLTNHRKQTPQGVWNNWRRSDSLLLIWWNGPSTRVSIKHESHATTLVELNVTYITIYSRFVLECAKLD